MHISVAMCTYNGARYIDAQLESIRQQQLLPEELVVCDDGSSDETVSIVDAFARTAPFPVRVFRNKPNLGVTGNFEKAIRLCQGELIALSDQDDIWYPHKLAVLSEILARDANVGGAFSDGDVLGADLQPSATTMWQTHHFSRREQRLFFHGRGTSVLLQRPVVTGMTMVFRSALRESLLPIPRGWLHDEWLGFLLAAGSRLIPCSERLVGYRTHAAQQVGPGTGTKQKLRRMTRVGIKSFLKTSRANNLMEHERAALRFDVLAERLRQAEFAEANDLAEDAAAKAKHERNSIFTLSLPKRRRLAILARQVGSYQRYSSPALQNMLRDLIL